MTLISDTRMILPGATVEHHPSSSNNGLKLKWKRLSKILNAVSNFQTIHTERIQQRSLSDPELENRIRLDNTFIYDFECVNRKSNTL